METISVLLADDDELICCSIASKIGRIRPSGRIYDVSYVTSAAEAMAAFAARPFDVLITDLSMPGVSGVSLVEHVRAHAAHGPLVVISAHDDVQNVRRAFVHCISDYLIKPVAVSELADKLAPVKSCSGCKSQDSTVDPGVNAQVAYVLKRVHAQLDERLTLKDIALELGVNYAHLSRQFNKQVNESFPGYVLRLRMERARLLLADPMLRISEVAQKIGYDDANLFSRDYKRHFGESPLKHRTHAHLSSGK